MSESLCRFSDAGNDELSTRSGGRRPKSAKARNRGRCARTAVPRAQLWGFERRTCRVRASARREIDFGGCRCQAFALTGDARATDPVCHLSPRHALVMELAAVQEDKPYSY